MQEPREVLVGDDVVRRPRKPWTRTVHGLLRHLHSQNLPVPLPLRLDERYEYVGFVPGTAGDHVWPEGVSVEGARSLGALLRRIHEATRDWTPPRDAVWSVPHAPGPVVCHGDPKPGNFAWRGGRAVGLFDWDAARPGRPLDDLAYALLWTVPLNEAPAVRAARQDGDAVTRRARAAALLDGYGWDRPLDVVEAALARHERAIEEVRHLGAAGHEPHAGWAQAGWPERWRGDLDALRAAGRLVFPRASAL